MPAEDTSVDHYAALQVSSTAQSSEIKTSYRKLALLYHPDRNHGNEAEANQKFQAIQAAYEVLTDATRRAKYDRARLAAGYGTAPTATAMKSSFSASTTAARTQTAAGATSNTAKRYTSTAGYASTSTKPNAQGTAFREWAATGAYASRGGYTYRDTDKEKSRSSDDDRKRRERERERSSKSHSTRAKSEFRPESPHTPTPRRSKESTHTSAYAHTTFYGRTEPRSSRGRSPEPSHTTRASGGLGGDSDPDYSHRPSRPYSYKPAETERFTTLRPNSPLHEGRKSDGSRYTRYNEPPGTYYATPDRERYSSRHSGYTEPSRKSRTSEEFEKPHVPPPSPPPEKEKDRTKFKYTFHETHETSDEDGPRSRRKSSPTSGPTRKSSSRTWGPPYVESEDDSDDGARADDEKASDEKSFEERMAGMNFGQTKDEKLKPGSWEGLKGPTPRTTMAPETPRRTPSPYGKSPAKSANSPLNKKKAPTSSTSPSHPHAPPPPPPQQPTAPGPGVFAFQVPTAPTEQPIPPEPAFDLRAAFAPGCTPRPQFAQYQAPVYASAPAFTHAPPPTQPYPFMRPASTQPISAAHKSFQTPAISEIDLKTMFESLTPGGVQAKKSEPNLRARRTQSKSAKPKITTKFSEMSISGNSSPVKDTASDGSRSIFGDTSSVENLKQKREKQAQATVAAQTASVPMDIDPPAPPQPPLSAYTPLSAKFEPIINGKSTSAADVPLPASPMNGFRRPSATPAPSKPDPLSPFHNLANLYPINTAENLGLDGMASLKDALPSSKSPTANNLDGKSRDEPYSQTNAYPQPPKPPTLPLPICLDANGKLDTVTYKPYWDAMQWYVDQWREYESKMLALLQAKLETSYGDFKEILTDMKAARAYNAKAKEERLLREEWSNQKNKFMMTVIEYHQLQAGTITPPVPQTNTSFLGNYVKSKFSRMPTFSSIPGVGDSKEGSSVPAGQAAS
ncbi:hypothetical protein EV426DRAFT_198539 [Tirmania nivea]|nr:hypothetical protein EV426DRAFT_198539 [Tirmania nivea]